MMLTSAAATLFILSSFHPFISTLQSYEIFLNCASLLSIIFAYILLNYYNSLIRIIRVIRSRFFLLVVPDSDLVSGRSEGRPRDVKPAVASEQLVGMFACLEEVHEALELPWVEWPDVCGLTHEVLRVTDSAHLTVHGLVSEARIDDDWPNEKSGWLQQHEAAIGQVCHGLHRRDVLGVLAKSQELLQHKMRR